MQPRHWFWKNRKSWTRNLTIFWNLIVQSLKHGPHCEWKECSQEPIKDKVEEQDQTPFLGGAPQELSGGPAVDEELPLSQGLVEGLLVFLGHGVCCRLWGERQLPRWKRSNAQAHPGSSDAARRLRQKARPPGRRRKPVPAVSAQTNRAVLHGATPRRAGPPLRPQKPDVSQKWVLKWVMGLGKVGFRKGLKRHWSVQWTHLREMMKTEL